MSSIVLNLIKLGGKFMKKILEKSITMLLVITMLITLMPVNIMNVEAAENPKLANKSINIVIGQTKTIKVKNVQKGSKITYKINKNIAKITSKGKLTGLKAGEGKVTVIIKKGRKKTKLDCKIIVKKPKLSKKTISIKTGEKASLSINNKPQKYSKAKYSWLSTNKYIATVSKKGIITGKKPGKTTVKVKISSGRKFSYTLSCAVKVTSNNANKTYTVKFNSNGGSSVKSQKVKKGQKLKPIINPTKPGYIFVGWFTDSKLQHAFSFASKITKNMTLYAKWEKVETKHDVKREEWIIGLSALFNTPEIEDEQYSFDDYAFSNDPKKLESAIRRGFVPLSTDGDNMTYFNPQEYATREFVAYTAIHALEYYIEDNISPEWSDAAQLSFPAEDVLAVNNGILQLVNNQFLPNNKVSSEEMKNALNVVKQILEQDDIIEEKNEIDYVDNVSETELIFEQNEADKKIYIEDPKEIDGWEKGEVHILKSSNDAQEDIVVKVKEITKEGDKTVLLYEKPEIEEVVTSMDVSGTSNSEGEFIPAEGVTIEDEIQGRAASTGEIPLFGKKRLSFTVDDITVSGSIDFKNLEYRFAVSPSWHLLTIDEVYVALNSTTDFSMEFEKEHPKNIKYKIGSFCKVPLGYGFFAFGDVYVIIEANGSLEVGLELTQKIGVQYAKNNGIRPVYDVSVNPLLNLKAEAKAGISPEINVNFLGIDLVAVGAEGGLGAEGVLNNMSLDKFQFCFDANAFFFLNLYAQIGWDELNLRAEYEIFNSDNSLWKKNFHFEETGLVNECTRGNGDYEGYVKRADNDVPIHNAKIQIIQNNRMKDTTYTDSHGYFKGIKLNSGNYKIRVSASGYKPYEQSFNIIGGQTTALETQLMISNENELEGKRCSGVITDAYTGGAISGATITVQSKFLFGDNEIVAQTTSNEDGSYEFNAPIGNYEITVEKEDYVTNTKPLIIIKDRDDLYISLSPKNQPSVEGNLRAVLRWGDEPEDLDSHMVSSGENRISHVYYDNMSENNMNLDVDDIDSYGPETISISKTDNGVYSYYVHDYTNKSSNDSTELSNSGAYIQLYSGNTLLYKIDIPQNQSGTLWHVFDYDSKTGLIQLVNEFSYQYNPSSVGTNISTINDDDMLLKEYEIKEEPVKNGSQD